MTAPLLEVEGLTVASRRATLIDDVSFVLHAGDRAGLIGESGSGKTITALALMGLLPDSLRMSGRVALDGRELTGLGDRRLATLRGRSMSMVFQEPMSALNPVMRIGRQVAEPLRIHTGMPAGEAHDRAIALLASVGVEEPDRRALAFPHELSGGQRQRAMIAMALACRPALVIADEPTTALDVTIQAQVLEVLRAQVDDSGAALLLITHDLPIVSTATERVMVLREGRIVESGATARVLGTPEHPYTAALVASVPPMSVSGFIGTAAPSAALRDGADAPAMVEVSDVVRTFRLRRRHLGDRRPAIRAVDGVSFRVATGETFGIVGESGSGKTTIARLLVGLDRPDSGRISVDGLDVTGTGRLDRLRSIAQMVFQDPLGSLDPRMTVGDIVAEPLRSLRVEGDHRRRVAELLDAVSLPADAADRHPHEFSGGQRQRIAIARALAPRPRLLVADEPVSALDMSVQTITLDLLAQLKRDFDLTMVFISHDLSVVHQVCDRVAVLEDGRIVEQGPVDQVFGKPQHPYTRALVEAVPVMSAGG